MLSLEPYDDLSDMKMTFRSPEHAFHYSHRRFYLFFLLFKDFSHFLHYGHRVLAQMAFFSLGKNKGLRKSSGCGPHAVRGEKSRRYGHRYFEKTRKSHNIENPFGQIAKSLKSDRQKTPRSIKIGKNRSPSIFRHRSHAWATDVLKIF